MQYVLGALRWVKSIYSERDGTGSSTRVHIGSLLGFVLGVGCTFAYSVHHKVMTIEQFDGFMTAAGAFIVTTVPVIYGLNTVGNNIKDWLASKNQPEIKD